MGRKKYSEDDRNRMITGFLRCAREIIDLEGIDQVSIRKVAQCAGYNSATIYSYFQDADELITLASIGYLENYCKTVVADIPQMKSPYEAYLHIWRVFSLHAFSSPQIFYHLFFYHHSTPLKSMINRYYEIYPNQVSGSNEMIHDMLLEGKLENRNLKIFRPAAKQLHLQEDEIGLVNDFTICYFKKLLEEHCGQEGTIAVEHSTQLMIDAINFLFRCRKC